MSHFLVYVFGENFVEQMAPYDENPSRDSAYFSFVENLSIREEYDRNEPITVQIEPTKGGAYRYSQYEGLHNGYRLATLPCQEAFPDFDEYAIHMHRSWPDPKTGKHGRWCNPNGHWDYYGVIDEEFATRQQTRVGSALKKEIDIKQMRTEGNFTPFAYVKDGQWIARAKMGWWASTSNEKNYGTWVADFAKLFDSLPDDTRITAVDCHT